MPRRHPGPRGRAAAHKNSKRTFCGTALEFVALFLGQSSIHGLNHLVAEKRTLLERFVWSSIVVLAIFGSVWVSFDIWRHYDGSPSAISMERNFMDWTTDMPSGTLCPSDRVDEEKLEAYVDRCSRILLPRQNFPNFPVSVLLRKLTAGRTQL
ncbi:hypothetical protein L798_00149 [Zootermopsis nevadensis]|uniref:Uncharacterized protein n=1 Tax=Zootermopsis nevadensis TaxID=136037 RepID=A0A067RUP3_ZOONE|nr:hypothetical protein L798_00149 [Zootermopsis nevadensis]